MIEFSSVEAAGIGNASLGACRYSSGVSVAVVAAVESVVVAVAVVVAAAAVEAVGPALELGDRLE